MTLLETPPAIETSPSAAPLRPREPISPSRQSVERLQLWRRWLLPLAALIVGLVSVGIFGVTPDGTGFLQAIDSRLSAAFHVASWRPTELSTAIASPLIVAVAALLAVVLLWEPKQLHRRRWNPLTVTVGAALTAALIGVVIGRPSPGHLGDLTAANATSFPSISAAMSAALACATVSALFPAHRRDRRVIAGLALAVAVPVAIRLLTAASWPLDEAAGILVGVAVAYLGSPSRPRRRARPVSRPRRRTGAAVACVVVLGLLVPVGRSYVAILTAPGNAPFDQRSVEWLRDIGMSQLVDRGESWWLWRHLPSPTATISELPAPPVMPPPSVTAGAAVTLPLGVSAPVGPALPREGQWSVASVDARGAAQTATTYFRPDPNHPSLVAAAAWINAATTKFTLIAGTRQPGGGAGPAGGHVPAIALDSLLAVFNSGYKMTDTPGGTLIEGRTTRHMVDGLATLAILPDGTATVGEWGTDLTGAQGYTGLRQNLHLMVANGAVVDGVTTNAGGHWGTVRNALPTWRSGLGVTAAGDLIYVAGNNLTLGVLANALVQAGAVTAMELDIHKGMVTFNLFTHEPDLVGHKLLPDMSRPADRYLNTDWRDFIMVTSR